MPKHENEVTIEKALDSELLFKGRFYMTMIDTHLKVIDVMTCKMFDLLSEPNFDQDSVSGMALIRSLTDKMHRLLILCQNGDGNFIQKVDLNPALTNSLAQRVAKLAKNPRPQNGEVEDKFYN